MHFYSGCLFGKMEVKGYEAKDLFTLWLVHLDLLAVRD